MKAAISGWLISALIVLCNATTFAQTSPPVSGATLVGTFSTGVTINDDEPTLNGEVGDIHVDYLVWLTSGGETVFSINMNSITFTGPCDWAETISLKVLVHEIALDGLARAISLGYITCTLCPATASYKVYYPTCVQRNLSGSCPVFTAAPGTSFSYNTYSICCSSGVPTISLTASACSSSSCGVGYELTCY